MNQVDIGRFIAMCRKEKNLTQAQLAEKLNITDRAISKWETGRSMPDSSIMLELCKILGITVNELLSGERIQMENYDKRVDENLLALKRKDENNIKINIIFSVIFSASLLIGIIVCMICDLALTGGLTWSLIPISSILFTWAIVFPAVMAGRRGVFRSLVISFIILSILIIPFLYVLSVILSVKAVFSIGAVMSVFSILLLWVIVGFFSRFRNRRLFATGLSLFLIIPFDFIINFTLSKMLAEPRDYVWDVLTAFILLILSITFFACDRVVNKRSIER